jgi:hypothetical protein
LKQWEKAMDDEYKQLQDTGTFEWIEMVLEGRKTVGSRWVLKEKHDESGKLDKFKG